MLSLEFPFLSTLRHYVSQMCRLLCITVRLFLVEMYFQCSTPSSLNNIQISFPRRHSDYETGRVVAISPAPVKTCLNFFVSVLLSIVNSKPRWIWWLFWAMRFLLCLQSWFLGAVKFRNRVSCVLHRDLSSLNPKKLLKFKGIIWIMASYESNIEIMSLNL